MSRYLLLAAAATIGLGAGTLAEATEIAVSYSFPRVFRTNETIITELEGSITATMAADGAITPAAPDPRLVRVNSTTYRTVFFWDDHTPRQFAFVDSAGDTIDVTAVPEPVMPFTPELHSLLVFHLTTAPASLWHADTGIYVWGLHDNCLQSGGAWEREAQIAVYDTQHQLVIDEPVGLRLNGNSSRLLPQKSFRLYFDDYGPTDEVVWDFFGAGPTAFQRLLLKGTWVPRYIVSSLMTEPLHQELGHLGSRIVPAAVYVNDEYWGAYTLRERLDDQYVETTLNLANDDYVFIKDSEAEHGDLQEWEDLLDLFAPPQDYASHAWYEEVRRRLDLTAYVDWLVINAFGATADNGYINNFAALKVADGPWRFLMWDEEELFNPLNVDADHLRFYASGDENEFNQLVPPVWNMGWWTPEAQRWCNIFRGLLQNSEFKGFFAARCDELLSGPLAVRDLQDRLTAITTQLADEAPRQAARWNWADDAYADMVAEVQEFIVERHPIFQQQQADLLDHFAVPVELSRFAAVRTEHGVRLTWRTERETGNLGFVVQRGVGSPDTLTPIASYLDTPALRGRLAEATASAYVWTDVTAPVGQVVYYRLSHVEQGGAVVVHDWIETAGEATAGDLVINEILADNGAVNQDEAGQFADWVELHNRGTVDLPLAGYTLTDDLEAPTRWTFPAVTIPAGGYLLVWCDGDVAQGPLHASFSLSADGESIGLFTPVSTGSQLVDSREFGPQVTDVSFGRQPSGGDTWVFHAPPTPGATNDTAVATPPPADVTLRLDAFPNPFNPRVTIAYTVPAAAAGALAVYGVDGRLVVTLQEGLFAAGPGEVVWDGRDDTGRSAPSGTYFGRLSVGEEVAVRKLVLCR